MFDLKISGGTIVDGTGQPRFVGDVGITDGLIAAVGPDLEGEATETMDATGLLVTPGFVDIHTHYDGQATWDPVLDPSASHGVTTVVAGNCGVGFAPVRPGQENWLVELMEGVEDIPGTALHEGIQWEWETFEQYLDALDRREYALDIAAFIPHAPLRVYVMGERGAANEPATADDIAEMAGHVRRAIEAGAVGFSTSRSLNHTTLDGDLVPGTFAVADELIGLAQAVVDAGGGLFEVVPTGETGDDAGVTLGEIELLAQVSKATGLPVSFLMIQSMGAPELWREQLEAVEKAVADGARLIPQVAARPGGMLLGVASYHALMRRPTFRRLEEELTLDELLAEMRKPEVKATILSETDLPADPHRQFESLTESAPFMFGLMFPLGDPPEYEPTHEQSIAGIAEATGRDPWDVLYDHLAAGELLLGAFTNYAQQTQDPLEAMIEHPDTVIGLSDGGAHVKMICDASAPTYLLTHWARDRSRGRTLSLETVVNKQAAGTAAVVGLTDRGTIEVGKRADLNVIDFEHLTLHPPRSVDDLPAGGRRILQDATGYVATIVLGVITRRDGHDTGARPGRLVRASH
ncbi:N-acyl-D-amino-acid deacylase family protein [Rhabdothermincola salaria]|uniref:N-acyl-D-amino-acid deacylase family protein n=1 Tax=Rhabdothermincola salaria TaxID=2903142 RepID=UPI001E460F55|nr:amidohydrolase family protein [Rhabdothermincola salaria]MCD9624748.1 amidohydrolase family protein [Rhabdothermincola salaria]